MKLMQDANTHTYTQIHTHTESRTQQNWIH